MYCIVDSIDPLDLKEDDNESDCSDSWELLDYDEKELDNNENNTNKTSTEQPEKNTETTTDKEVSAAKVGSSKQQQSSKSRGQKQKQKVSFEIPDLVKGEQTIDLTTIPKDTSSKQSKAGRNKNKKQTNAANLSSQTTKSISQKGGASEQLKKDEIIVKRAQVQPRAATRAPILNYAAALAAKLDNNNGGGNKTETLPKKTTTATPFEVISASQSKGVVKRNRPVSSSSWSSCDDELVKEISQVWDESGVAAAKEIAEDQENAKIKLELPTSNNNNNGDGDSMVSSGFSDCDYGFGGLNDYVMRPKRAQAKRRRNASSTSSSLLSSMAKRGNVVESSSKKNDRLSAEARDLKSKDLVVGKQATLSRHIKPKKKKLVLSSPTTTQSDFLKRPTESVVSQSLKKSSQPETNETTPKSSEAIKAERTRVDNERQLMPPPSSILPASNTSGNESSDIPDMDESWYVTPPPCFTGAAANKLCIIPKPKAKEAARENLLIEHPSIYIASPSKQVTLPSKKSTKEILIKQKAIVLKKVSSKQSPPFNSSSSSQTEAKKLVPKATGKVTRDSKNVKCWDNKFVVNNWANQEAEDDDDDFDNLFPISEKQVISKAKKSASKEKSKQKPQQDKTQKHANKVDSSEQAIATNSLSTDGYESDFSIPSPPSLEETVAWLNDLVTPSPEEKDVAGSNVQEEENSEPKRRRRNKSSSSEPKVPVKVEPIEPERQPGWQLKKRRSKRRPLVNSSTMAVPSMSASKHTVPVGANAKQLSSLAFNPYGELSYAGSLEGSARSTPTFINRIGSSIVANLSSITSGFASSAGMNMQARAPMTEINDKMNHIGLIRKSENSGHNLKAHKQMSKASLNRRNSCSRLGSCNGRPDRRVKMHTTPNGVSVNRKVQTNFH